MKNTIIIPALEPTEDLISYVEHLLTNNMNSIVIVNDGSSDKANYIFKELSVKKGCTVLTHTQNMGKGAALKTAIHYINENMPRTEGIITADADGQHSVEDVIRMNIALSENKDKLILGVREFDENTPTRSMLGNKISAKTLNLLYGIKLNDTQTGLRAISRKYFDWLLTLDGQRYEYELNMLIYSKKIALSIHTITIQTLYFDNNSASHFRAVRDGAKVYGQMLKGLFHYMGNSCISAITDITIFTVLFYLTNSFLTATIATTIAATIARIISSVVDFRLNRSTFASKSTTSYKAYFKYYTLWSVQLCASIALVTAVSSMLGIVQTAVKPFTDILLAMLSYQVQLHWVFKAEDKQGEKQGFLFQAVKVIGRRFVKKNSAFEKSTALSVENIEGSAVLVGHHQNMYGPIVSALYLPNTTRIWVLDSFFSYKACFNQYYSYTFTKRMKMPKIVAYPCAVIASLFVPALARSARAIPVYRQNKKITETFKQSIAELKKGNQVLIFPDIDYTDTKNTMGETYCGYIRLAKLFKEQNGQDVPFIPVSCDKSLPTVTLGDKIFINPNEDKKMVAESIASAYNRVAKGTKSKQVKILTQPIVGELKEAI